MDIRDGSENVFRGWIDRVILGGLGGWDLSRGNGWGMCVVDVVDVDDVVGEIGCDEIG